MQKYKLSYINAYMHANIRTCIDACIHTHMHTLHTCLHTCIDTYFHTYADTCIRSARHTQVSLPHGRGIDLVAQDPSHQAFEVEVRGVSVRPSMCISKAQDSPHFSLLWLRGSVTWHGLDVALFRRWGFCSRELMYSFLFVVVARALKQVWLETRYHGSLFFPEAHEGMLCSQLECELTNADIVGVYVNHHALQKMNFRILRNILMLAKPGDFTLAWL